MRRFHCSIRQSVHQSVNPLFAVWHERLQQKAHLALSAAFPGGHLKGQSSVRCGACEVTAGAHQVLFAASLRERGLVGGGGGGISRVSPVFTVKFVRLQQRAHLALSAASLGAVSRVSPVFTVWHERLQQRAHQAQSASSLGAVSRVSPVFTVWFVRLQQGAHLALYAASPGEEGGGGASQGSVLCSLCGL